MKTADQKLINILFEIALVSRESAPMFKTREEHMHWVAEQLSACGYHTIPCGASWGTLVDEETRTRVLKISA